MKSINNQILIIFIAFIVSLPVSAQSFTDVNALTSKSAITPKANGCGSANGWDRYLVPNEIRISQCTFLDACNKHDICYGQCAFPYKAGDPMHCEHLRCKPKGDLHGRQECESPKMKKLEESANIRKAKCDANFMSDIVTNNSGKNSCIVWAAIYSSAVLIGGKESFLGATEINNVWTDSEKKEYFEAIQLFFSDMSEDEIKEFKNKINNGNLKINYDNPIKYISRIGLQNK